MTLPLDGASVITLTSTILESCPMDPLDPLDAAMVTAEPMSQPLHVAAVLILSPPDNAGPGYVDELYRRGAGRNGLDRPAASSISPSRLWTPAASGSGVMLTTSTSANMSGARHCRPAPAGTSSGGWSVSCTPSGSTGPTRCGCLYLIDGLDDGRFAFYVKVHHAVMDGVAGFQRDRRRAERRPDTPVHAAHLRSPARRTHRAGQLRRAAGYPIRSPCCGRC